MFVLRNLRSSLLPFDPKIEKIACALRKATREASQAKGDSPIFSSDSE